MAFISENNLAALIGTSNHTVQTWADKGLYPIREKNGKKGFDMKDLDAIPEQVAQKAKAMVVSYPMKVSGRKNFLLPHFANTTQ